MELSALRIVGLALGAALLVFATWRRRTLRNGDVLLLLFSGIALLVVSGTELLDSVLELFSFQRGNGGRILGLAVFSVIAPVPAHHALAGAERPDRAQAVRHARGHRVGGVPPLGASRSASATRSRS